MTWCLSNRKRQARFLALAATVLLGNTASAQSFSDNFNTGTDSSWTRSQPLSGFGAPGTYSFPGGNTYRIQATTSPNTSLGPARAGSVVTGLTNTNFTQTTDLVNFDSSLNQSFGLVSRISNIGLGTSNGYAFLATSTSASIYRITGEADTSIGVSAVTLTPGTSYQMKFIANGSSLLGQIFLSSDLSTPLATVSATDGTYTTGFSGLLVAANANGPAGGPADATFDNYAIAPVPEPTAILGVAAFAGWGWRRLRKGQKA